MNAMALAKTKEQADEKARTFSESCFEEIYDQLLERQLSMELEPLERHCSPGVPRTSA